MRTVGLGVLSRRYAHDAREAAREVTLVAEARVEGHAGDRIAAAQHLARAIHPDELQVHVRRQTVASTEPPAEVERAHPAQVGELEEGDRLGEVRLQVV